MSVTTLPPATAVQVISSDSVALAEQCQHHAVRTAVQALVNGTPSLALLTLLVSVRRCAHLDNRPLSAERVQARAESLVEQMLGDAA
jgi:hypothetical protein